MLGFCFCEKKHFTSFFSSDIASWMRTQFLLYPRSEKRIAQFLLEVEDG